MNVIPSVLWKYTKGYEKENEQAQEKSSQTLQLAFKKKKEKWHGSS